MKIPIAGGHGVQARRRQGLPQKVAGVLLQQGTAFGIEVPGLPLLTLRGDIDVAFAFMRFVHQDGFSVGGFHF